MRRNILKQRLKAGETAVGSMVQEMTTPTVAQVFKQAGFDFFMIDGEHSPYSLETAGEIIRVGRLLDMCPLMRVKGPEYDLIAGALDIGAMGIMLPRVEAPHHVETLLDCMKYPPVGHRGLSSDAPHSEYDFVPLDEFVDVNNQDTMAIVQIERKAAIERIDELLSVPGVDVALIGPEDLSLSLGVPGQTDHPMVVEAIETVIASAQRNGVVPGIHMGNIELLLRWHEKGMRMIMYDSDLGFLMAASASGVSELRTGLKGR
jgi:2-dehydro-3-deoxyglucarate aldolase/4-hydroxy-2-oxoheptanedioate aldolase